MHNRLVSQLLLVTMLIGSPAWAMEHHSEVLQDSRGYALKGATVYVYLAGTQTLATIYSDNGTTVKPNPFLSSTAFISPGYVDFYAANGVYDIVYSLSGYSFDPAKTKRIALFDVNDFSTSGGDITDVWSCTIGNCTSIVGASGNIFDASNATKSSPAVQVTALPGTCTSGQLVQWVSAGGTGTYICTTANTWVKFGVDGAGGGGGASAIWTVVSVSANTTMTGPHAIYVCDATAGPITLTMPIASSQIGADYMVRKADATSNACTIARSGSDLIDGQTSISIILPSQVIGMYARVANVWDLF